MKNNPVRWIWECGKCDDVVVSYSNIKWDMNYCECGESAVDLEEHYCRQQGPVKVLSIKEKIDGEWKRNLK